MKKTVLISLDALSETEFDRLKKLKNFKKFLKNGVYSKSSLSVYPTQTYTVHTSVATGSYPDKHGVYNNQFFQPFVFGKSRHWFWYRHQVQGDTIYDVVGANGGRVTSILWPVTGKARIKYNIPEIVAVDKENQTVKVLKNGSLFFTLSSELKHGKIREGLSQPKLDEFAKACAVDNILHKKPDLLMLHLVCIDTAKHKYGVESKEVDETLKVMDEFIGEIMDACKREYTIVMFSDHGQFTVQNEIYANVFLQQQGMLSFENKTYDAYIECMGGAAAVRAKDEQSMQKAIKLLTEHKEQLGIEDIYPKETLDKMHAGKDIEYMIEAKVGYCFKEGNYPRVIRSLTDENISYATHGYNPRKKGYGCLFFAMGEGIQKGVDIGPMEVVDIAPTTAKIMGVKFPKCDGRVLDNVFLHSKIGKEKQ